MEEESDRPKVLFWLQTYLLGVLTKDFIKTYQGRKIDRNDSDASVISPCNIFLRYLKILSLIFICIPLPVL